MRIAVALFCLSILMPAAAFARGPAQGRLAPDASAASHCPRITSYLTDDNAPSRGRPLLRKLTQLPPATAYMAVYRHIGACNDPLTMADYRQAPRQ